MPSYDAKPPGGYATAVSYHFMNSLKVILSSLLTLFSLTTLGCTSTGAVPEATPNPVNELVVQATATQPFIETATSVITSTNTTNSQPNTPEPTLTRATPSRTPPATSLPAQQPTACNRSQITYHDTNNEEGIDGVLGFVLRLDTIENGFPQSAYTSLLGGNPLQEQTFLPSAGVREIGFSPNENWFAYQSWQNQSDAQVPEPYVHLIGINGERLSTLIPFDEEETNGFWFGNWINDDLMLLIYDLPSAVEEDVSSHTYTVFDPFTGERFPHILDSLPDWNTDTTPYFSPDMTRVVYLRSGEQTRVMVLWDLIHEKELWRQPFTSDVNLYVAGLGRMSGFAQSVMWAPDSSRFVISSWEQEQYSSATVERNGEQNILLQTSEPDEIIYEGTWSPNNRYIAYINHNFDADRQSWFNTIMLYDFDSSKIVELCSDFERVDEMLWSANSQYLGFLLIQDQPELITLNIYTGEIISLGTVQNFLAARWLENESWLQID